MIRFSVIMPTIGRPVITRALDSIARQELLEGDEVLVIGDTLDGPLPETERIVESYGEPFRYLEYAGEVHAWGTPQRHYAFKQAREGNWFTVLDDTDIYAPDAFAAMRKFIEPHQDKPHIFSFMAAWGVVSGKQIAEGKIGGHNFVWPNVPGKIGTWTLRYQGDYDFITSTLDKYPDRIVAWHDYIISDARGGYAGKVVDE